MATLSTITDLTLLVVSIWERPWGVVINPSPHFTEEKTEAQEGVVTFMGRFSTTEPEHPYVYIWGQWSLLLGGDCRQVMHTRSGTVPGTWRHLTLSPSSPCSLRFLPSPLTPPSPLLCLLIHLGSCLGWEEGLPGEGKGNPLQYSCLENSMDRGGLQSIGSRVAKSQTE